MVTWELIWIDRLLTAGIWVRAADLDPERSVLKTGASSFNHHYVSGGLIRYLSAARYKGHYVISNHQSVFPIIYSCTEEAFDLSVLYAHFFSADSNSP